MSRTLRIAFVGLLALALTGSARPARAAEGGPTLQVKKEETKKPAKKKLTPAPKPPKQDPAR